MKKIVYWFCLPLIYCSFYLTSAATFSNSKLLDDKKLIPVFKNNDKVIGVGASCSLAFYKVCHSLFLRNGIPTKISQSSRLSNTYLKNLGKILASQYLSQTPVTTIPENLTLEEAQVVQTSFVEFLSPSLGKVVGYKAGLTNKTVQEKFGVNHPVQGILLEKMLLKSGTSLSINFGTRPMLEGDLIVRVGSEKINTAKTPQEVISALDAVIPFLELPDLVYDRKVTLNASRLVAINLGARYGIIGEPIALKDPKIWENRLRQVGVVIIDENNKQLAIGDSRNLLGDPIKVILWLRDSLKAQGKVLKKGDLLSLGSMTAMIPIQSPQNIRAIYTGLSDNQSIEITVKFTNP